MLHSPDPPAPPSRRAAAPLPGAHSQLPSNETARLCSSRRPTSVPPCSMCSTGSSPPPQQHRPSPFLRPPYIWQPPFPLPHPHPRQTNSGSPPTSPHFQPRKARRSHDYSPTEAFDPDGPDWSPTNSDAGASRNADSLSFPPTTPGATPAAPQVTPPLSLAADPHISSPTIHPPVSPTASEGNPTDTAPCISHFSSEAPLRQTLWHPMPLPQEHAHPSAAPPDDHIWPSTAQQARPPALSCRGRQWFPGGDATPDDLLSAKGPHSCNPASPSHGRQSLLQPPLASSSNSDTGAVPSPSPRTESPLNPSPPQDTPPPPTPPPSPFSSPCLFCANITLDCPARNTFATDDTCNCPTPPPSPSGTPPAAASSRRRSAPPSAPRPRPPSSDDNVSSGTRGHLAAATAPNPHVSAATRGCQTPEPLSRLHPIRPFGTAAPLAATPARVVRTTANASGHASSPAATHPANAAARPMANGRH